MHRLLLLLTCSFSAALSQAQTDTTQPQDTSWITVHVIYGSKPLVEGEGKWFGGKLGGHIGLEVAPNNVVHFNPGGAFRIFGRRNTPGTYTVSRVADFYCTFGCDSNRLLAVRIPVNPQQHGRLKAVADSFHHQPPYPYAFFGMRCAAACYHLLSVADVFPDYRKGKMIRRYFYPRRFRKRLLQAARKHQWEITTTPGRSTRKWDHD